VTLWQRVVQANRPGPPEHSVPFRVASTGTVIIALGACWSQGELSAPVALFAVVATALGNTLSYLRRERPWPAVKPILAVCAVGGFVWFIATVSHNATPGDISTVEGPLAVLFAWVLCTHAFDVPARRDVAYSLAGSAALMAVAAAQSVDLALGVYVVAWVAVGLWGLVSMWQSMAGAQSVPWLTLGVTGIAVAVVAFALVAFLPAPKVSASLIFPSSSANSSPVDSPSNLTDGSASLPAHAASPTGRTGVGGFLGFAKSLDTGARATLGNQVVLRVRASRPSFWVGQTYDYWNGQSWVQAADPANGGNSANGGHFTKLDFGSPFEIPLQPDQEAPLVTGTTDVQTFYLAQTGPNLVFHADNAERVYLQSRSLFLTGDGTIVSAASMGAGTVYTVVSNDVTASGTELRQSTVPQPTTTVPPADQLALMDTERYLQLPHAYPRVDALAHQITAGIAAPGDPDPHTYDKVAALEGWMARNIRYTTDIPALAPGADAVTSFLFGSREGYCEQISTATVVMLRTLGIPARETVGYVPGSYNPITDLYDVQAKDAHAWVQVWFPGYGWQNFDPTAVVPLANPSPGSVLAHSTTHLLAHLPWIPIAAAVVIAGTAVVIRRRRRLRPPTWAHQVARDLERGGARRGTKRRTDETLSAFGERLAAGEVGPGDGLLEATALVERATYGGIEPSADQIAATLAATRRFAGSGRRHRGPVERPPGGAPPQERETASASSNDAPAASSGR
jgi:protein-glutamine gamma-glutamyltransferase